MRVVVARRKNVARTHLAQAALSQLPSRGVPRCDCGARRNQWCGGWGNGAVRIYLEMERRGQRRFRPGRGSSEALRCGRAATPHAELCTTRGAVAVQDRSGMNRRGPTGRHGAVRSVIWCAPELRQRR